MMARPTDCPDIQVEKHEKNHSDTKKNIPIIDVFLNPERKGELEDVFSQQVVKKSGVTYTKVGINKFLVLSGTQGLLKLDQ